MKIFYTFLVFLLSLNLIAQEPCISHHLLEEQILNAADPIDALNELQALKTSNFIQTKAVNIIQIPIVFHIIHNGDAIGVDENLTDAVILEQLERINTDFRGKNLDSLNIPTEFLPFFADIEIEFCLAKLDPDGNFTTGINRYNYNRPGWDEDSIKSFVQPQTIWDRDNYLNVWSFNFSGFLATNSVNGFATPPLASTPVLTDGIVLNYTKVGNDLPSNIGRTAVHEIGHYLGLFHIWGDDSGLCTGDDGIADTPNQADSYSNCPSGVPNSCGSNDMYMNYMDYSSSECSLLFTENQKTRMYSVLNGFRDSLLTSTACNVKDIIISEIIYPQGTICQENVFPSIKIKNIGNDTMQYFEVEFYIDDIKIASMEIDSILLPTEESLIQFPPFYFAQNIVHEAKFKIVSLETGEYPFNNADSTTFNTVETGEGISEILIADFEDSTFPPTFIFIENPDNDITWQYYQYGDNQVFYMDNFNNSVGSIDAFTTTDYNLNPGFYFAYGLTFNYAYKNQLTKEDTLSIYYSLDCGINWINIFEKFGNGLSNNNQQDTEFFPNNESWNTIDLDLHEIIPNYLEFKKIRFKFENISGSGNNLFINDIEFIISDGISEKDKLKLNIYPNPSSSIINISVDISTELNLRIFNSIGEKVIETNLSEVNNYISTKKLPNGIYYIKVSDGFNSGIQKLVVSH